MDLYLPEGWLDIESIRQYSNEMGVDQIFIVGARGTGKSYGIQKSIIRREDKFVYLRMSAGEIKMMSNPEMNPFNAFYDDPDLKEHIFSLKPIPKTEAAFYLLDGDDYKAVCLPLATFGKYRGMDFHEYKEMFLDEFIPERTIKKIYGIGTALKQSYETVNRNRELKGEKPVKLWAAANSLDLNNEILLEFGLIPMMEKLLKSGKEIWIEGNKMLIYPQHSPISEKKAQTSLYKNEDGKFSEMALGNQFTDYSRKNIGSRSIKGSDYKFRLVGVFSCYKLQNGEWYFTRTALYAKPGTKIFLDNDFDKRRMLRTFYFLADTYLNGKVIFESPDLELQFLNIFKIKL